MTKKDKVSEANIQESPFDLDTTPISSETANQSALLELTNLEKIRLLSQTNDEEITRITCAVGLAEILSKYDINIGAFIQYLILEKLQLRVSNNRLGRVEQIEGVRGENTQNSPLLDLSGIIRNNLPGASTGEKK
jgi:hypothetical protein